MRKIAVVGLGIMGHAIADNLIKGGYEVFVWNRSFDRANDLIGKGAHLCTSPREAAAQADIVFEVTADDKSSQLVWLGENGILAGATAEKFLIACPTLSVNWVEVLSMKCSESGLTFFDMPMTGGRMGAESGQLILLAGGDQSKMKLITEELSAISKAIKYFGPTGSGTKYKLILNTFQAVILAGFGEAMAMAKESGLSQEQVAKSLTDLPGGYTVNVASNSFLKEPEPINFSVEWIDKDLHYASKMARRGDYPMRDIVLEKFDDAIQKGYSKDDWTRINKL